MKNKGIVFNSFTEQDAINYLTTNNNFFKLSSYRKNYPKSDKTDKYVGLDFAHLVDLSIIDMHLRMILLKMTLNIEHATKVQLLIDLQNKFHETDGLHIVQKYVTKLKSVSQTDSAYNKLQAEISRNKTSVYCQDLYDKYPFPDIPVWAFLEMISLGSFIRFYKYCADHYHDKEMNRTFYLLLTTKHVRNAAAHNNCLLNNILTKEARHNGDYEMMRQLALIGVTFRQRSRKLSNERIQQIVTCLYAHKQLVHSEGLHKKTCHELETFQQRLFRGFDYRSNLTIRSTFLLLNKIIDNWFKLV